MMFRISCRWQTVASLLASLMQVLWLIACTVSLAPTSPPAETATLMVGKLVDRQQASPGDVLTYTLVVMNDQLRGDDPGRRVQLVDRLPAALELVADSLQVDAAYDAQAHAIR